MKITSLSCPSCGGRLEPMNGNPQIMICEYCNSQFAIEKDVPVNVHIHSSPSGRQPVLREEPSSGSSVKTGIVVTLSLISIIVVNIMIFANIKKDTSTPSLSFPDTAYEETVEEEPQETGFSPLYETIVETIFEKDADLVTENDLAKIKYIRIKAGSETSLVEYSFQSPYEESPSAFEPVTLQLESLPWDSRDLSRFTGLQKMDLREERISEISFEKFPQLKGLSLEGMSPWEVSQFLPSPGQIVELSLDHPETLEGIADFEHLQQLSVERIPAPDLKQLVSLKDLCSLSIEESSNSSFSTSEQETASLTDYSAISTLTNLQHLEIDSEAVRDLRFLEPLTGLTSLAVSDTEAISLEPLARLTQLRSLKLADNDSLLDYSPICNLAELQTLVLDKGTSQPDPDLSSLVQLEELDLSGFISISFLGHMSGLRHLSLHNCNADEIQALSGLTNLESLTCYSIWTYAVPLRNVRFIDNMTNLKSLDFSGGNADTGWGAYQYCVEILGDISNVFNHQGLERLVLNNCTFGIDFDQLQDNPSLTSLEMKEINLKENFYVESYGGMTNIWYDDVTLDDHTDFLTRYPSLKKLYLDGNQLTHIRFAASLKNLTHLGLNNNYVTELSPLNQVEHLEYLDIRMNPVNGTVEAGDTLTVLK